MLRAQRPRGRGGGGGGGATPAGVRYLLAGLQAWHAQAQAAAGQLSAIAAGL